VRRASGFRGGRRRQTGRPLRSREWTGFETSPSGIIGEPGRILFSANTSFTEWALDPDDVIELYDEPTIIRLLISDQCHPVAPNAAASIACSLYVGIMTSKDDSFPPGIMFADDATNDWLYWSHWMMFNGGTSDGFINAGPTRNGGDTIDIRSKRKLETGEGLLVCAYAAANNSHTVVWALNARCLLLNG